MYPEARPSWRAGRSLEGLRCPAPVWVAARRRALAVRNRIIDSGRHTDLLFSVAWRGGGEALVYLLFEHQSTSDGLMAFRILRYLVRI